MKLFIGYQYHHTLPGYCPVRVEPVDTFLFLRNMASASPTIAIIAAAINIFLNPLFRVLWYIFSRVLLFASGVFEFQPLGMSFEAVDPMTFTEVLYPKSIYDIIDFFMRECIKRKVSFRVCKHCNQFFALTGHINTEYCNRPFDSEGRTCKEMGALRLWEKKAETPALKAYSKEYKQRFAWIKYGKISKESFYEWVEGARKRRDLCVKGVISIEDFKLWLEE